MPEQKNSDNIIALAEFSRPVDVTTLGKKGKNFEFFADDNERAALAKRYSVIAVDKLEAHCDITPVRRGHFRFNATFTARVVQSCVISLAKVEEEISTEFTLLLQQGPDQQRRDIMDVDFSPDQVDIEFLTSDIVDAGEIISQYLSLEINPYPRKPGVTGSEYDKTLN